MTKEELIQKLKVLQWGSDMEMDHVNADALIVEWLIQIGYPDVAEAYSNVPKWYA